MIKANLATFFVFVVICLLGLALPLVSANPVVSEPYPYGILYGLAVILSPFLFIGLLLLIAYYVNKIFSKKESTSNK